MLTTTTSADITEATTAHDTNLHMHKSNGLIVDVGNGHTHSTGPGKGYTKTHHHDSSAERRGTARCHNG